MAMAELQTSTKCFYDKLSDGSNQIRLLTLSPSRERSSPIVCFTKIHPRSPQDTFFCRYEALSYAWGDAADVSLNPIVFNGQSRYISSNLEAALRVLRYQHSPRILWVDALCINQTDLVEKNVQVGQMHSIYAFASRVVVWLGPGSEDSDLAMSFLSRASTISDFEHLDQGIWDALENLCSRAWFSRVWVLQEFKNGRDPIFLCGNASFAWNPLQSVFDSLWETNDQLDLKKLKFLGEVGKLVGMSRTRKSYTGYPENKQQRMKDFVSLLKRHSGYQATEAHDKIYALIGLESNMWFITMADGLRIRYEQPVVEVYTEWTEFLITKMGSLELLYAARRVPYTCDIPSWVPDWRLTCYAVPLTLDIFQDIFRYTGPRPKKKDLTPHFEYQGQRILSIKGFTIMTFGDHYHFSQADPTYLSSKLCSRGLKDLLLAYLAKGCKMKNKTGTLYCSLGNRLDLLIKWQWNTLQLKGFAKVGSNSMAHTVSRDSFLRTQKWAT